MESAAEFVIDRFFELGLWKRFKQRFSFIYKRKQIFAASGTKHRDKKISIEIETVEAFHILIYNIFKKKKKC